MSNQTYLYAGCYTHNSSEAIRVFSEEADGSFAQTSAVESIEHASFLAAHPDRPILYAVSETDSFGDGATGGLHAFRIGRDGSLELIAEVASLGVAPCHVSVDTAGHRLFVANYMSGSFAAYELLAEGIFGELIGTHHNRGGGRAPRQEGPHAHCIIPGPAAADGIASTYGVDLGVDRIVQFREPPGSTAWDLNVASELQLSPGAGPRHITFHPHRPLAFVACELSSAIAVVSVDPHTGGLRQLEVQPTIPDDFEEASTVAEVSLHPNGRFVYVSNRGHDSIAIFELAPQEATLRPVRWVPSGGRGPRHFRIHPSGTTMLVANEHSNTIVAFTLDPTTGLLDQRAESSPATAPVCLLFSEAT